MSRNRFRTAALVMAVVALMTAVLCLTAIRAAEAPVASLSWKQKRKLQQAQKGPRPEYNIHYRRWVDGLSGAPTSNIERSIIDDLPSAPPPSLPRAQSSQWMPPILVGNTYFDMQQNHSMGHQIARNSGADVTHFCWTDWDVIPASLGDLDRFVKYSGYVHSSATFCQPFDGAQLSLGVDARAGFVNVATEDDNSAHAAFHQYGAFPLPYTTWGAWFPVPCAALHIDDELLAPGEYLWPKMDVHQDAGVDYVHVIAHDNDAAPADLLLYWRFNGATWDGPVIIDATPTLGYVLAADPGSSKVAIVLHTDAEPFFFGMNNVAYYESVTKGGGWLSGAELGPANKNFITGYSVLSGPQAWVHIAAAYDNSSVLHVVWDEQRQANSTADAAIRHWNSGGGITSPVAFGVWDNLGFNGVNNLNLAKLSLGIGDGATLCEGGMATNDNYLYVVYTQFGGLTAGEQGDLSTAAYMNGEIYLTASRTGGVTWCCPVNLTGTPSPLCAAGTCASDNWASIARVVGDVEIMYITDRDAGAIPLAEGAWTLNDVVYEDIPGGTTDAAVVCPPIVPNFAVDLGVRSDCLPYLAVGSTASTDLTIYNLGDAMLTGTVSELPPVAWLTVIPGGAYAIAAGGPPGVHAVIYDATGLAVGPYSTTISITHNDPCKPSPIIVPIDLLVVSSSGSVCPTVMVAATNVASPGVLRLAVGNDGRLAAEDPKGGLFRPVDGSSGLFDGSLLVAHGAQGPDTTVYHHFGDNLKDPGQFGFVPQGAFEVDTSHYGSGGGYASVGTNMLTKDSALAVHVDHIFPQHPDSANFVLARYCLTNISGGALSNLAVGLFMDFDVLPASRYGKIQSDATNGSGQVAPLGLVYQAGRDTAGHVAGPLNTATRYRAGMSAGPAVHAEVKRFPGGLLDATRPVVTSGMLYRSLSGPAGVQLDGGSGDMYTLVTLARNMALPPDGRVSFTVAYASDTISEASLSATIQKAWGFAAVHGFDTSCPTPPVFDYCLCAADPECDSVISDVLDVVATVAVAFRGAAIVCDAFCLASRTDTNCDGRTDVLDVVNEVAVAFRGANPATVYCDQFVTPPPPGTDCN